LKPIAILGAGAWGTALAIHLAHRGQEVRLWSMAPAEISAMLSKRENSFLPGFTLNDAIIPTSDLAEALLDVNDVIIAIPSVAFRKTLTMLHRLNRQDLRIISATKGLEAEKGQLLHQVVTDELGDATQFAVISGPSFAKEVAALQPTSIMIASHHQSLISDMQTRFQNDTFRLFPTNDVVGVEIGAIIKNIAAIAVGIADGLQLGANAKSAIITQGLHEMLLLGNTLHARTETLVGLAGAGDLILTCTDNQSRNRRFGLALGQGKTVAIAEKEIGHVVEGKSNLDLALKLAKKQGITLVIANAVSQLLLNQCAAIEAVNKILDADKI
jgi:glycerol-3-phosphate dehydrogenase (NAD(P)+)